MSACVCVCVCVCVHVSMCVCVCGCTRYTVSENDLQFSENCSEMGLSACETFRVLQYSVILN